jgi:hypothetical protein
MQLESTDQAASTDIVWGAKAIGQVLGLTERQTYHRLESDQIPCARKFGTTWAASKRALQRLFEPASPPNGTSVNEAA